MPVASTPAPIRLAEFVNVRREKLDRNHTLRLKEIGKPGLATSWGDRLVVFIVDALFRNPDQVIQKKREVWAHFYAALKNSDHSLIADDLEVMVCDMAKKQIWAGLKVSEVKDRTFGLLARTVKVGKDLKPGEAVIDDGEADDSSEDSSSEEVAASPVVVYSRSPAARPPVDDDSSSEDSSLDQDPLDDGVDEDPENPLEAELPDDEITAEAKRILRSVLQSDPFAFDPAALSARD